MGIRFSTNTWRAPLQLIDCWLPLEKPAERTAVPKTYGPTPRVLQRFIRAGWLNRQTQPPHPAPSTVAPNAGKTLPPRLNAATSPTCATRWTAGRSESEPSRSDARLVLSGRIGDVCAELDRLAALEHRLCR